MEMKDGNLNVLLHSSVAKKPKKRKVLSGPEISVEEF